MPKTPKPTLLLLHGVRGDHHGLEPIAQHLRKDFKVVNLDLPGSGDNPAHRRQSLDSHIEWLHRYVARMPQKPIIVAHSMGSIIASHYLERYPDDTDQPVVWLSPIFRNSHNQRNSHALYRILQIGTSPLPPPVRKKLFAARWVSRTVSHYLTHDKAQQEAIDQIHYQHSNCFDTARSLLADTKISMRQQTIIVKKRTTYMIFGANDKLTDSALTKQIANKHQIPHHEISYTGHLLNYETPEDVAKIIKKFLKTNPQ